LKQKSISYLFVCFLLFLTAQEGYAQSVTAIKKRADAAFEKKEYESAKVDYRQLLAQNQKNLELNYKYATCIYFTEDIKNARKYFDFILAKKDAVFPLETYYYIGKIYQHQYYFETAIQQFNRLKEKDPKLALTLDVQAEINACQFALAGMKDMRTLQVIKKSQPYGEAFYDHYSFLDDSYSFYKASEVFSKENAKRQYEPIYAFKRGMKFRVFASYGPESQNLDVYIQKKNVDNEWDKPIKIQGTVNTVQEEVYPFFDAENGYLYFSSKGHQSMGGFDLYRAIYSLETNVSSEVENLRFPFSSPNDDYFYIPDLSNGNANFASNRNGKLSAIQTYLVSAAETPKELYFFTGILSDKIDQSNSTVKVEFIVPETNERFGPFISQGDGTYLVGLPGPGTYQMEISVTGSNQLFKEQLMIPQVDEDMELQQELIYAMIDSKEQLKVLNRIKPKQAESMQLLSQKMNLAANLDVNLASFSRKVALTPEQKIQQEWGVSAKDTSSLIAILSDSLLAAEVNLENQVRLTNYLAKELAQTYAQLTKEMQALDERLERGSGTIDPTGSQRWIEETKQLEFKVAKLEGQVRFLESWMTANQQRGIPNIDVLKNLEEINKQVALLQYQQNSEGIMDLLSENRTIIKQQLSVAGEDLAAVIRNYTEEQVAAVSLEQKQYQEQLDYQIALQKEIVSLKEQAKLVKPKDRTAIDAEIHQKEALNTKISGELSEWSENLKTQEQGLRSFAQVEQEVLEKIVASEKMSLPTSAIPYNLAEEQKRQQEITQKRTKQQQLLTKQVQEAKEWQAVDPTYAADIARINQESDVQTKASLLKEREELHLQALKTKAATVTEVDQEFLTEQIQLTENRVKTQGDLVEEERERERAASAEASAAEGTNTTVTNQQSTETGTERAASTEASAAEGANTTATNQQSGETGTERAASAEAFAAEGTNTTVTNQQSTETGTEQAATAEASAAEGANTVVAQTVLVDQVKDTPRMTSIEQTIREVEQISSASISPNEKAYLLAELEATLALEKRRAAIEESLELLGTNYSIIRDLQQSYEQGLSQVNTLNIQAMEQALQSEKNPEKAKVLLTQIESLKSIQTNSTNVRGTSQVRSPNATKELILPLSSGDPENITELQAQSSYVQYASQRVSYQQNLMGLDSLGQVKSQIEDSMRILLTQENEISIRELQQYAERYAGITQNIEKSRSLLQEQRERLLDFTDQTSYEWMIQNGIQATTMLSSTKVSSTVSTSAPVPFAVTAVTTMNQRFPEHPINVSLPNGLIFRVQVGAFRKPVPNQLFREFGPVSGEVLANGLTCYLAGYFNGSLDAVEARTMIRRLGYTDAFIVAYCDGKRMSFNEGKDMEANGTCRKQTAAELQIALNQLMQQNQMTVETPSQVVPLATAVDPNSTEANLDLYYTVQVAVYNKALNADNINGIKELLLTKTEKGQFRYSSGEFTSFAEARQRKNEVVTKGIPDAYVVAYYRGKRISIGEANQLLASGIVPKKRGMVVPVSTNNAEQLATTVEIPMLKPLVKKDTVVQYELKVNEDNFLSQLTRLNRIGTFTYQADKNRIVSEKFVVDNISINQQLYLADMKRIREKGTKIPSQEYVLNPTRSDFYDWLLHQTVTYDVRQENEAYIFRFYPENEEQKEWVDAASQRFKWTLKQK